MPFREEFAVSIDGDTRVVSPIPHRQVEVRCVSGEGDVCRSVAADCGDAFGADRDAPVVVGIRGVDDHRLGTHDGELGGSWRERGKQYVDSV